MEDGPRVASPDDATTVTGLVVGAFFDDPTWSWAFPDPGARRGQHRAFWGLFVEGALRHDWVWLAAGDVATSIWIPPGRSDMSEEQEARMEALLPDLLGPGSGSARVSEALELFEAAHPRDEPHYYLSLLATDPAQRGHGYGLALLADNLRLIDAEGAGAYLEASNPANVALYERYGFAQVGAFDLPDGGPTVHTMWRSPRNAR
ncbi:MAG: GNAT family N-acetyltransferase [Oryzihumus sp.]